MSSLTSTPAALASELRAYDGRGWRFVEAQHLVSTLKLVDSLAEQALLEELIETTKPPLPAECRHLDYLLATPFRYDAEYPRGSRFRRAGRTPGVFYASEQPQTAIAEIAFYRLLFFAESPATPWPKNAAEYTGFAALVSTAHALDLTAPPLDADRLTWTDPLDYQACQNFADSAREAGALLLRYESVRDPQRRANLAVLSCAAFAAPAPMERQTWRIRLSAHGVQALCEFPRESVEFSTAAFANDPRMAMLKWER
jgi:hypothetical protein